MWMWENNELSAFACLIVHISGVVGRCIAHLLENTPPRIVILEAHYPKAENIT